MIKLKKGHWYWHAHSGFYWQYVDHDNSFYHRARYAGEDPFV